MKINFSSLRQQAKQSLDTTIGSLSISTNSLNILHSINNKQLGQSRFNYQSKNIKKITNSYASSFQLRKADKYFSKINAAHKQSNETYKQSALTNMIALKSPKKFKNLKTISEMQYFIKHNDSNFTNELIRSLEKQPTYTKNQNSIKRQQKITQRLYNDDRRRYHNGKHTACTRKTCKKLIPTKERQQIEDLKQKVQFQAKQVQKLSRSFENSKTSQSSSIDKQIHIRLHKEWLKRKFNQQFEQQQYQQKQQQKINQQKLNNSFNQEYEKKYVKFYDRLDQLARIKNNKMKQIQRLNLSSDGTKMFKPETNKSKLSHKMGYSTYFKPILSVNREKSKKKVIFSQKTNQFTSRSLQQTNNPINKTQRQIEKNQNSTFIVTKRQQQFLEQIKQMLYNKSTKKITINLDKVSNLSQKQFNLFFPLIQNVERTANKFKTQKQLKIYIKTFYETLDTIDKQEFRRLKILQACRTKNSKSKNSFLNQLKSPLNSSKSRLNVSKSPLNVSKSPLNALKSSFNTSKSSVIKKQQIKTDRAFNSTALKLKQLILKNIQNDYFDQQSQVDNKFYPIHVTQKKTAKISVENQEDQLIRDFRKDKSMRNQQHQHYTERQNISESNNSKKIYNNYQDKLKFV